MKMRIQKYKNLMFIGVLLIANTCWSSPSNGTVGFEFLRTTIGARPAAMGDAFVAISGDINSLYYNPAGLAEIGVRGGTAAYLKHLLDFHSGQLIGTLPFNWGTLGLGINYINFGEFKRTSREDPEGMNSGTFGANSFAITLGAGKKLRNFISLGANLKYVRATIENFSSDAFALDFGTIIQVPLPDQDHVNIGISIGNLGQTRQPFIETKDDLPLVVRAGVAKKLAHLPLLFSGQVYKYKGDDVMWAVGGEFILSSRMFLRLGYDSIGRYQKIGTSGDRLAGANLGFGIIWRKYRFDYSFSSVGDVGSLNRIGFTGAL